MHKHLAEWNILDDTLIGANESQNISEMSNSGQSFSSASTEKKTSHEKMEDFLENKKKIWKKLKGSYQKNKKLEHQEQKFQEKLCERMEHQDETFNQTMYCVRKHGTPDINFVKSMYHDVTFS